MKNRMPERKLIGRISSFLRSLKRRTPHTTQSRRTRRWRLNFAPSSSKIAPCSLKPNSAVYRTNKYSKGGFGRTGRTPMYEKNIEDNGKTN